MGTKWVNAEWVGSYVESLSDLRHTRNRKPLSVDVVVITVSGYLRSAVNRRLLKRVKHPARGSGILTRGRDSASDPSAESTFELALDSREIFEQTSRAIVQAYPPGLRPEALEEFARALGMPWHPSMIRRSRSTGLIDESRSWRSRCFRTSRIRRRPSSTSARVSWLNQAESVNHEFDFCYLKRESRPSCPARIERARVTRRITTSTNNSFIP